MNFLANFLKIIIVLLVLAVAAVVILMGAMVLFPTFSVFGIHYVSGDDQTLYCYYDVAHEDNVAQWQSVDTFAIVTNSWDVYVFSNQVTKLAHTEHGIDAILTRKYSGFANNDVASAALTKYVYETKKDGEHLTISTIEPTGWFSRSDCALYVYVDVDTLADKKLSIQTQSGKVVVGEEITNRSHTLRIDSVDVSAGSSNTFVNDVQISDYLAIHKSAGNININPALGCDVQLGIDSGLGNVYVNTIGSESNKRSLVIDDLCNNGVTIADIYGDMMVSATTGVIKGGSVSGTVVFEGVNCSLSLNSVGQKLFFNSVDGSLSVQNAASVNAQITGSGAVNISNLTQKSTIETAGGRIVVDAVSADLTATSTNGDITLGNKSGATVNYIVKSTNGSVKITNICGSVHFDTTADGKAQFYGSYSQLIGTNEIKTVSGEIKIDMLDASYGFLLQSWYTTTSVYFKLSGFEEFSTLSSADDPSYSSGVRIGGYGGSGDTLAITSRVGKLRVVHPSLV